MEEPWLYELNQYVWVDEETGYYCYILRGPSEHLNGYVGIPSYHAWFGLNYSACSLEEQCEEMYCEHSPDELIDVHGGITYSYDNEYMINLFDSTELPDRSLLWVFGFDCAHTGDLMPKYKDDKFLGEGTYRDYAYVKKQCELMAKQLKTFERR